MNTRYPRIREAYTDASLVHALDRLDALANSTSTRSSVNLAQLVLVPYLDILEDALREESASAEDGSAVIKPGSLLQRALEAVHQALDAFGLLEPEPSRVLN
ncbi:MAG TPA: hypothetical protein VI299_12640 [Polyangiales bacterium]